MYKMEAKQGQVIINYGDMGDEYYVLAQGKCQVTVYNEDANPTDPNLADLIKFVKTIEAN